jgi:endonuclease/exonuclease/phosphatase family metal-dependent hydrolase
MLAPMFPILPGNRHESAEGKPSRQRVMAIVSATIAVVVLLGGWIWAVFVFQPFGHRQWTFAAIALTLVCLVAGLRPARRARAGAAIGPQLVQGRSFRFARCVFAIALACWLGLIVWSALSPGGATPPAKSDVNAIRVLTWNILHGTDTGMPWKQFGWPVRKKPIQLALASTQPDILCVQEALEEQSRYLGEILPGCRRVGVGRDDGRAGGEQCSIFFDEARFEELAGGTFWLEEPTDRPAADTRLGPKRICTWVRLRDRQSGRSFRVYNTHQYLSESARVSAARLILAEIETGDPSEAVLVAGDFNAPPETRDRRLFEAVGLNSTAQLAGAPTGSATYQFYGIRLRRLDDILVNRGWRVAKHYVLDLKPENTYPSDHFGVMADLLLSR